MVTLLRDLRHAIRILAMNRGFTMVAILILAIGIGANIAVFSIVDAWLIRPLPFKDPGRIAIVFGSKPSNPREPLYFDMYRDYLAWKEQSRSFDSLGGMFWRRWVMTGNGDPEEIQGMFVTSGLFHIFGVPPLVGRAFEPADLKGPPLAVIGFRLWQRRFRGSPSVIGRSINLGNVAYQVVGVMPPGFDPRMLDQPFPAEVWTLLQPAEKHYGPNDTGPLAVVGRLKAGVEPSTAQTELKTILDRVEAPYRDWPKGAGVLLTTLKTDNTRTVRLTLLSLAASVAGLLLIACSNLAALLLGRGSRRRREFAIRAALGCGRGGLVRQLMVESLVIAAAGALCGVALAYAAVHGFVALNPLRLTPANPIEVNGRALGFAVALAAATAALFGWLPAMTSSQVRLEDALRAAGAGAAETRKRRRFQRTLVAGQVAITLALLVGATLMARTFSQLTSVPLGFDPEGAMAVSLALPPAAISASPDSAGALLHRIMAINGVEAAAIASVDPLGPGKNSNFEIPGDQPAGANAARTASLSMVTPEYFSVLSIRVLRGRSFSDFDNERGEPVVIMNDLLARETFPGRDPIGQSIHISGESGRRKVVGVVANTRTTFYNTLAWERKPRYYLPWMQTNTQGWSPVGGGWWIYLRVASAQAAARGSHRGSNSADLAASRESVVRELLRKNPAVSELRRAVATWNPDAAVAVVEPMTKAVGDATAQPRLRTTLLCGFGVLALMLAALGVYAVISQWVIQRRREIGIRIALGARRSQLLADVLRQAAVLVGTGLLVGIPLAMALSSQLRSMLYSVSPLDPAVFVIVAAVLLGTAGLAAYLPARSAANVDPMEALRDE